MPLVIPHRACPKGIVGKYNSTWDDKDNDRCDVTCTGDCEVKRTTASSGTISDGPFEYYDTPENYGRTNPDYETWTPYCKCLVQNIGSDQPGSIKLDFIETFGTEFLWRREEGIWIDDDTVDWKDVSNGDFVTINTCSNSSCIEPVRLALLSGTPGVDATAPWINNPASPVPYKFHSSTGFLQLVFTTDYDKRDTGWTANWSCMAPDNDARASGETKYAEMDDWRHTPASCGTDACAAAISSITDTVLSDLKTGFTVCVSPSSKDVCVCVRERVTARGCARCAGHIHILDGNVKCVSPTCMTVAAALGIARKGVG